jgi:cytoskeletal protein RodZ
MRKLYLITAILLLSCVWAVAQNSTPPSAPDQQNPSSQQPSSQNPSAQPQQPSPSQPDTAPSSTQPATGDHGTKSVEGCIGGAAGSYTLTDSSGKTWQLSGDTSKLGDHVGHTVQATGSEDSSGSFNVKKVKMLSGSCANK